MPSVRLREPKKAFRWKQRKAFFTGRDDWIRTSDLTHPKRARYQAAPRPVKIVLVWTENALCQTSELLSDNLSLSRKTAFSNDDRLKFL